MPVRPVAALLDATTRHRKASAYSLLAGFVFGCAYLMTDDSASTVRHIADRAPPNMCPVCRFGWLIWIDAAVRGPYLWTPDGLRPLVISGSPLCLPAARYAPAVLPGAVLGVLVPPPRCCAPRPSSGVSEQAGDTDAITSTPWTQQERRSRSAASSCWYSM